MQRPQTAAEAARHRKREAAVQQFRAIRAIYVLRESPQAGGFNLQTYTPEQLRSMRKLLDLIAILENRRPRGRV